VAQILSPPISGLSTAAPPAENASISLWELLARPKFQALKGIHPAHRRRFSTNRRAQYAGRTFGEMTVQ
jgi:hypothetical protein